MFLKYVSFFFFFSFLTLSFSSFSFAEEDMSTCDNRFGTYRFLEGNAGEGTDTVSSSGGSSFYYDCHQDSSTADLNNNIGVPEFNEGGVVGLPQDLEMGGTGVSHGKLLMSQVICAPTDDPLHNTTNPLIPSPAYSNVSCWEGAVAYCYDLFNALKQSRASGSDVSSYFNKDQEFSSNLGTCTPVFTN